MSTRPSHHLLALVAAAAVSTLPALARAGTVEVVHGRDPALMSDLGETPADRARTLAALTSHLRSLASRLPADTTLRIELLDVDLAGEVRPRTAGGVRVLRGGADWPRVELSYALTTPGQAARTGHETLADLNYQWTSPAVRSGEPLAYEKRLLDRWFARRFGPGPGD